ncbi:hypothetical protein NTH52_004937 [Vibrio harveyi]|nr:hypothetical protein [Vibrio harveyi]
MDIENINWQLIFIALGFLALKLYLSAYLKKKGENLATKEDVKRITKQVEAIRVELETDSARTLEFESKCNDNLVKFYDYITEFHYEYLLVNFGDFPSDDGKSLFEYQKSFGEKAVEILKQYQRLVIYLKPNDNLLSTGRQASEIALNAEQVMKSNFTKVKRALISEDRAYLTSEVDMDSYYIAVEETNVAVSEFNQQMKPLKDDFFKVYKGYLSLLNVHLNKHSQPDA